VTDKFVVWMRTNAQLLALVLTAVAAAGTLVLTFLTWRAVGRANQPELSLNAVYLSRGHGHPLALVVDYQNVGRTRMDWLEFKVVLINSFNLEVTPSAMTVVRPNPTPPGVIRSMVLELKNGPHALALCARWLNQRKALSSSQWYYVVAPAHADQTQRKYLDAVGNDLVTITNFQPCGASRN